MWLAAVLVFGVGDVVTTILGLRLATLAETGPVTAPLVAWLGPGVVFPVKTLTFAGCYVLWRLAPSPHRVGVPLGLVVLGGWVTGWNLAVMLVGPS